LSRRIDIPLLLILALGAALRLWHYDFDTLPGGIPLIYDADKKLEQAMDVAHGDPTPWRYKQPYLLIYATAPFVKLCEWAGRGDRLTLWHMIALLSIAASLLTLVPVYLAGRYLPGGRRAALLGALLLAVVPVSVIGSRYFKEDVPLGLLSACALLSMLDLLRRPRPAASLRTGALIGLAVAMKYAGIALAPFFVAAHIASAARGARWRAAVSPWLLLGLALIPAVFLALNPFVLAHGPDFSEDLRHQVDYVGGDHMDHPISARDYMGTYYLRFALAPGLSIPVLAAAAAGIAIVARRRDAGGLLVAAWVVAACAAVELSSAKPYPFFERYLHPVFPWICLLAGIALDALWRWSAGQAKRTSARRALAGICTAACVAAPLAGTAVINAGIVDDTRLTATAWMNANLPAGSAILMETDRFCPRPSKDRFKVRDEARIYAQPIERIDTSFDYVVVTSFARLRRPSRAGEFYAELARRATLLREFRPRYAMQTYGFHNPVLRLYQVRHPDAGGTP
jgi:4-amino-4-deoxy-L-arabinose transferase-like glycosyltransferase